MNGPLPSILRPLTVPASWGWRLAIDHRNRRFDRGHGVRRAGIPIVSVGNLSTGGTGKTPMVQWIVDRLLDAGRHPAVCLRGYGSRAGVPSDEQQLYESAWTDVPVLANPDRSRAVSDHLAEGVETDCAVLDDGFQHRHLDRDLDLVLIDASRPLVHQRLLPDGHLREPLSSLSRASAVIVTHAEAEDPELTDLIVKWHGKPPIAWTQHRWTCVHVHRGGERIEQRLAWLSGRRFVTRLGIGHPDAVHEQLHAAGATTAANMPARDHAPFTSSELAGLAQRAAGTDGVFMTAKDWVKAEPMADELGDVPVIVPVLRLRFLSGQAELLDRIEAATAPTGSSGG